MLKEGFWHFAQGQRSLPIQCNTTTTRQSQMYFKSNVIWMIIYKAQTVVLETSSKHLFTHYILTSPTYLPRFHSFIPQSKSGNSCFYPPIFLLLINGRHILDLSLHCWFWYTWFKQPTVQLFALFIFVPQLTHPLFPMPPTSCE